MDEVVASVKVGAPDSDVALTGDPPPSPAVAAAVDGVAARPGEREGHAYYDGDDGSRWTVTEAIDASGFGRFQLMMLLFTGLAWMGDAMEMMLLSFLGPSVRCEWGVSPTQEGRLTSVVFVGMLFGAPTWGVVADARGRRVAFFATTILTFVAGLASAFSPSFGFLLFARTLVGFGLGGVPTAFALFMEFLPAGNRGKWLVAIEVFWTLGSVVEAGLAWAILPKHSWRVLLLASTAPLALLLCVMWIVPESPHYLAAKGDAAGAAETLRRVSRANGRNGRLPRGVLKMPAAETSGGISSDMSVVEDAVVSGNAEDTSALNKRARELKKKMAGLAKPFATVRATLSAKNRTLTLMLWFVFFAVAFLYYGVVLLTTEIHVDGDSRGRMEGGGVRGGDDATRCTGHGSPDLPNRSFLDIFVSAVAELPGLAFCALALDALGRRRTLGSSLAIAAACVLVLTGHRALAPAAEASALAAARASRWRRSPRCTCTRPRRSAPPRARQRSASVTRSRASEACSPPCSRWRWSGTGTSRASRRASPRSRRSPPASPSRCRWKPRASTSTRSFLARRRRGETPAPATSRSSRPSRPTRRGSRPTPRE